MLRIMRENTGSWIIKILLFLIVPGAVPRAGMGHPFGVSRTLATVTQGYATFALLTPLYPGLI